MDRENPFGGGGVRATVTVIDRCRISVDCRRLPQTAGIHQYIAIAYIRTRRLTSLCSEVIPMTARNRSDSDDGSEDWTSVWRAVKTGTIVDVQNAIDQIRLRNHFTSPYVNWSMTFSGKKTSALYVAVLQNDDEKVRLLIDCDAELDRDTENLAHDLSEEDGDAHERVLDIIREAAAEREYQSKHCGDLRDEGMCG